MLMVWRTNHTENTINQYNTTNTCNTYVILRAQRWAAEGRPSISDRIYLSYNILLNSYVFGMICGMAWMLCVHGSRLFPIVFQ